MSQVQTVKVYAEIKGFPNYSVAPDGEVFSINRGRPLKWYMITVINDKELGKVTIVTQQYQVGLYVAIYKNKRLINQFGSNLKEAAYHRKVRIRAIKRGGTIVEGTVLEIKSKYPINVFENESSKEVSK